MTTIIGLADTLRALRAELEDHWIMPDVALRELTTPALADLLYRLVSGCPEMGSGWPLVWTGRIDRAIRILEAVAQEQGEMEAGV